MPRLINILLVPSVVAVLLCGGVASAKIKASALVSRNQN
jgi:hypothetical protein